MRFHLQYKLYRRAFSRPVRLGPSLSRFREGILLKIMDEAGRIGFGEVAPLESFGSESVEKASLLFKSFCGVVRDTTIAELDGQNFPCVQYALESAVTGLKNSDEFVTNTGKEIDAVAPILSAGLLQQDDIAEFCRSRGSLWNLSIIKLKIGSDSISTHDAIAEVLGVARICRAQAKRIRLDANEQLSIDEARQWMDALAEFEDVIEFIEQPLDRWYFNELQELADTYSIPIALDESLQMLQGQIEKPEGLEPFLFVIKPSLGDLKVMSRFGIPMDRVVISSVFETAIGFSQLLELAPFDLNPGLDTQTVFDDKLSYPKGESGYHRGLINLETVWNHLA